MADAAKTSDAHLFVGGSNWMQDLSEHVSGFTIGGDKSDERITTLGSTAVEHILFQVSFGLTVDRMFYGDATDVLDTRQGQNATLAVIDSVNDTMYFGATNWTGSGLDAPTDSVVARNIEFLQNGDWTIGQGATSVTPFSFKPGGSTTQAIGGTPATTDTALVVVTTNTATARNLTIGSASVSIPANTVGMFAISLTNASGTDLSINSLPAATKELSGYLLVGQTPTFS